MPEAAAARPDRSAAAAPAPRTRRPGFWLLIAGVLAAHLWLSNGLLENRVGWGSGDQPPPRIEVAFVRELVAAAPPAVVAPPPRAARRLPPVAKRPLAAASAPATEASAPTRHDDLPPREVAEAPPPPPLLLPPPQLPAEPAAPSASAVLDLMPPLPALPVAPTAPSSAALAQAAAPAASAASAAAFEWPPSTRLSYHLSGDYRGPVEGSATVEWLRQGTRYQVHLETAIGPVLSRHITSEGELTENGLAPRRFDGEQKVIFRAPRRWQLRFGPERVVLADGKQVPAQPGAQDEASQFVQLTWLFTTQPQRLQVGRSVDMPLAISRKLERWYYDVVAEETLHFPFGAVATFHLKPRREAPSGDLTPEVWIAPTLQYLPVRILIHDNKGSWVDLTLESPPLQAAQK
jgi:hypothetical protein